MQGVLLCLLDDSLARFPIGVPCPAESHEITSLSLCGLLARCICFRVTWGARCLPAWKDSELLPMLFCMDFKEWSLVGKVAELVWGAETGP